MIIKECVYDPVRDLGPVEQEGFVELDKAYANGVIPENIESDVNDGDECNDPSSILDRPRDVFESIQQRESIVEVSKPKE